MAPNPHGWRHLAVGPAAASSAQCFGNHSHRQCDFSKSCWVRKMLQVHSGPEMTRALWVRLTHCVRTQMLRPQSRIRLSSTWITTRWKHRQGCRSFGSVLITLNCADTKKEYHKSKEDQDQLVTLLALPKQQCAIFWGKYYKGRKNCSFPFKKNVHLYNKSDKNQLYRISHFYEERIKHSILDFFWIYK